MEVQVQSPRRKSTVAADAFANELRVGRSAENEIPLDDELTAPCHGAFVARPAGWAFEHRAFRRETIIRRGGRAISLDQNLPEEWLLDGDQICIGASILTVQGILARVAAGLESAPPARGAIRTRGALGALRAAGGPPPRLVVRTRGAALTRGAPDDGQTLRELVDLEERIRRCVRRAVAAGLPLRAATQEVFGELARALFRVLPDATDVALVLEAEYALHQDVPSVMMLSLSRPGLDARRAPPPSISASIYFQARQDEKVVLWQNGYVAASSDQFRPLYSLVCSPLLADHTFVGALQVSTDRAGIRFGGDEARRAQPFINRFAQFWIEQRLQHAQEQQRLARLAAQVSHDLRNAFVLAVAHNDLALHALQGGASPENVAEAVDNLERNNRMLRRMTEHFHLMAQSLSGADTEVTHRTEDLREMLKDLESFAEPWLRMAGAEMKVTCQVEEPLVCSAAWLVNCFNNLCKNACQAMEENPPDRPCCLNVRAWPEADPEPGERPHAVIEFRDTGQGMTGEEVAAYTAGQLATTKREGLGLGTQSILRALELHQAPPLEVESVPGIGTTVRLRIPADLEAAGE
jgi:signal transduction histidine kinase